MVTQSSALDIRQFPCLADNYGVILRDAATNSVATIDVPDANAVSDALNEAGWTLTHILVTHHHWDHTQGVEELKAKTGATVIGPKLEAAKIPGLDTAVGNGDTFSFGTYEVFVHETPGHTAGHVIFHVPDAQAAFVGDTLFAMGCGRVTEGSMAEMHASVMTVAGLPPETALYCGHEYTVANAEFALTVDPDNQALKTRADDVRKLRAGGKPTLPTRVDVERETNPFLRAADPAIRAHLGMQTASDTEVFAEIRERKNRA
ncbi:MAG: hydroxyacylglutathione hydrolase [Pseudomonadota bacterium]